MKFPVSAAVAVLLATVFVRAGSATQTCEFTVTPTQVELNGSAQSGFVNVQTQPGCAWTVDSSVTWLHPGTAGAAGSGIITYSVDAVSSSTSARQGFLRVRWNTPTAGQNVVVTQTARPCNAFLYPGQLSPLTIGWKGGSRILEVLADLPFSEPWRVTGSPGWITVISPPLGLFGYGDGATTYIVASNPSPSPRDGVITFCSGQTIPFHQAGRSLNVGRAVPADFDGDGIADLVVYRPSTRVWFVLTSSSGFADVFMALSTAPGAVAMPGDYDGENKTELALYNPSGLFGAAGAGNWNIRYSSNGYSTATQTSYPFPYDGFNYTPQNVPLMADFNGDDRPDFITWRPDTAEWSVALTDWRIPSRLPNNFPSGEYNGRWQWGLPGDVPVPA